MSYFRSTQRYTRVHWKQITEIVIAFISCSPKTLSSSSASTCPRAFDRHSKISIRRKPRTNITHGLRLHVDFTIFYILANFIEWYVLTFLAACVRLELLELGPVGYIQLDLERPICRAIIICFLYSSISEMAAELGLSWLWRWESITHLSVNKNSTTPTELCGTNSTVK